MTKEQLIGELSRMYPGEFTKRSAGLAVEGTIELISSTLERGEKVSINGFGVFEPKHRAARMARKPRTNEPYPIPARITASFKPGKRLKEL